MAGPLSFGYLISAILAIFALAPLLLIGLPDSGFWGFQVKRFGYLKQHLDDKFGLLSGVLILLLQPLLFILDIGAFIYFNLALMFVWVIAASALTTTIFRLFLLIPLLPLFAIGLFCSIVLSYITRTIASLMGVGQNEDLASPRYWGAYEAY
jgi:hypothetical protein